MNPRPILNTPGGESSPITEIVCPSRRSISLIELRRRTRGPPDAQFFQLPKNPEFDGLAGILPVNRAFRTELASARELSDASTGSGRAILPRLPGTRTRAMLDNQVGLTPEQQAQNLLALQRAEFRPWELSPDLITAGLWIAYALFALMWLRMALRQNE